MSLLRMQTFVFFRNVEINRISFFLKDMICYGAVMTICVTRD